MARLVSGVIMAGLAFGLTWLGSIWFVVLVAVAAVLMLWEWAALTGGRTWPRTAGRFGGEVVAFGVLEVGAVGLLLGAVGASAFAAPRIVAVLILLPAALIAAYAVYRRRPATWWLALGLIYVGLPASLLIWLRLHHNDGLVLVL